MSDNWGLDLAREQEISYSEAAFDDYVEQQSSTADDGSQLLLIVDHQSTLCLQVMRAVAVQRKSTVLQDQGMAPYLPCKFCCIL